MAQLFCHFSFLPVACQIDSAQIKSALFLRNQGAHENSGRALKKQMVKYVNECVPSRRDICDDELIMI